MQGQGLESLIPNKKGDNKNKNNQSSSQKPAHFPIQSDNNQDTQNNPTSQPQEFNQQPQQNSNPAFKNQVPVKPQQEQTQPNQDQSQNQRSTKPPVIKRGSKQKPPAYYPPGQQDKQNNQQTQPQNQPAPNPPEQNRTAQQNNQQQRSQPNTQQQTESTPFKVNFEEKTPDQSQSSTTPQSQNQEPKQPQEETPQSQTSPQEDLTEKKDENQAIFQIEVGKIKPNPLQPRKEYDPQGLKELAQSIREVGIIQPLVVSRIEEEVENGTKVHYQLISGERRLRASKIIGLKTVPAVVRREEVKQDKLSMALIENIQRSDLNPVETARAYSRLQDEFSLTQREIATRVGKSRESVSNTLRLLNLPTDIQNALSQGKLNESQARILLSVKNPSLRDELFNELLKRDISTRKLRTLAKGRKKRRSKNNSTNSSQQENFWAKQIEDTLGIPVSINNSGKEKRLTFKLHTQEEWDTLMKRLIDQGD